MRILYDGLVHRFRPEATVLDELGREQQGVAAVRIFEPEHVAALFIVLSAIVANGGYAIEVKEHGVLGDGSPTCRPGASANSDVTAT